MYCCELRFCRRTSCKDASNKSSPHQINLRTGRSPSISEQWPTADLYFPRLLNTNSYSWLFLSYTSPQSDHSTRRPKCGSFSTSLLPHRCLSHFSHWVAMAWRITLQQRNVSFKPPQQTMATQSQHMEWFVSAIKTWTVAQRRLTKPHALNRAPVPTKAYSAAMQLATVSRLTCSKYVT